MLVLYIILAAIGVMLLAIVGLLSNIIDLLKKNEIVEVSVTTDFTTGIVTKNYVTKSEFDTRSHKH